MQNRSAFHSSRARISSITVQTSNFPWVKSMLELSTREVGRLNPLNSRETLQNNSEPNQQPTGHAKEGLALFWLLIGSKTKTDVIPTQNRKVWQLSKWLYLDPIYCNPFQGKREKNHMTRRIELIRWIFFKYFPWETIKNIFFVI